LLVVVLRDGCGMGSDHLESVRPDPGLPVTADRPDQDLGPGGPSCR
jgi:hypothetical protein